jgi:hypothetical protein
MPVKKECAMKSLIQRMLVSSALALVSFAPIGHAMAQSAPQAMYKDLIRPNGQKRSDAVYQADVTACYQQTGSSPYLPDNAAMKKCMLGRGYQFVWQRGFGSGSGGTVASRSGTSDDDYYVQQTLQANHQAEQQQEEQNAWALQQSTMQQEQQSADQLNQEMQDMAASQAAADAQNALSEQMANQVMMNNQ